MKIDTSIQAAHLGSRLFDAAGKPIITGICLHDTAGSGTHNDTKYLANPSDGRVVSVDFTVEREGFVYQLNPDLRKHCTWHAGRATRWLWNGRKFLNRGVTQTLIGIELVQKNNLSMSPIWPDVQLKAVADLCLFLCSEFGLKKEQITTHSKVITDGSRSDPRQFPFDSFWFFFNREANAPAVNPKAPDLGSPIMYVVKPGDSLWKISKQFGRSIEDIKHLNGIAAASNLILPGQTLVIQK